MREISIRPYRPADESAIQEITYRTGFNGEDLTGRKFFDDKRLFFLIFIGYYTRFEPEHCFVAIPNTDHKKAVGFICGTPDTLAQEARFNTVMPWWIARRAVLHTSWRHPRTLVTLLKMNRKRRYLPQQDKADQIAAEYPAHLHINLMPGHQGLGIGSRLIQTFEAHIRELEIPGIHLSTSNKNDKAVPFYKKMGYHLIDQSDIVPHPHFNDLRFLTFAKKLSTPQDRL